MVIIRNYTDQLSESAIVLKGFTQIPIVVLEQYPPRAFPSIQVNVYCVLYSAHDFSHGPLPARSARRPPKLFGLITWCEGLRTLRLTFLKLGNLPAKLQKLFLIPTRLSPTKE
jgi:hypothetical protein